jgi:hypothetical protein
VTDLAGLQLADGAHADPSAIGQLLLGQQCPLTPGPQPRPDWGHPAASGTVAGGHCDPASQTAAGQLPVDCLDGPKANRKSVPGRELLAGYWRL